MDVYENTGEMPTALKNEPPMAETDLFYYLAFGDLTTCRTYTFSGLGPIPWTAANEYAIRHEVEDFEVFWACIKAMDSVFLEHTQKKVDDG